MADLRTRPIGATAMLGRTGYPTLHSATGGRLDIVTGASQPGFNPLDLLFASLAACMSMSARIAARDLGLTDAFHAVRIDVTGEKAADEPSRFKRLTVILAFEGTLSDKEQVAIAHRAEEICTVSNSLTTRPALVIASADTA